LLIGFALLDRLIQLRADRLLLEAVGLLLDAGLLIVGTDLLVLCAHLLVLYAAPPAVSNALILIPHALIVIMDAFLAILDALLALFDTDLLAPAVGKARSGRGKKDAENPDKKSKKETPCLVHKTSFLSADPRDLRWKTRALPARCLSRPIRYIGPGGTFLYENEG
jgi:hypothetical protein